MGMMVGLLILAAVIGTGIWLTMKFKPKGDDVLDAEPVPKPFRKTGAGTGLALFKPDRVESEVKLDAVAAQSPKHMVVRTWIGHSYGIDDYRWKCACGVSGDSVAQWMSRDRAADHVRDGNKAEELKAKTNGRFSW